ncbi:MAG: 4-hydroxyphenylacetate 3-hydroxylase family protein [Chloroflexaceae bacterium]|jgi:4-hydroxyphenylacetate 3-monooxygenase|nr:4-hydroxyphenylacetate 3-hydroxylase family protein [Chloroflexaceae bacterium]
MTVDVELTTEVPPVQTGSNLMTGAEYLESLRDGREIYLNGERVQDVTTHPAFRNAAASIARVYDSLHDPQHRDTLTTVDRFGNRTHKFFTPSYTPQELLEAREAIALWSRMSYGFQGRTPDYKASFMASLGAGPEFYEPYAANASRWYQEYASRCLFLNHVIVDPPVDRNKPLEETRDVYLHVEEETDGGLIISGAKMMGTGSALTHATFVAQNSASAARLQDGKTEDFALVCLIPISTPGQKLICRASYESSARSPFDNPISSRYDENDAVLVFDKAFVPWDNVLVYRDINKARGFYAASGFMNRYVLQATTRLAVKLDFMCGLLLKGVACNGTADFRGVQVAVGEVIAYRNLFWALTAAMCLDTQPGVGGSVVPKLEHASAARVFAAGAWAKIKEIFDIYLGGAPLVVPSSYRDLENPELRPLLDRFYRGTDMNAEERIKLYKLIWDVTGSEFAGRYSLYERNYSGNHEQMRIDALAFANRTGRSDEFRALVDQCMSDYGINGWTGATWSWEK